MNLPPGFTRDAVKARYALFTPAGYVPSVLPGWEECTVNVLISPALGAQFSQILITLEGAGRSLVNTGEQEHFAYVISGKCSVTLNHKTRLLTAGHYIYVPPETEYQFGRGEAGTKLLLFEKKYVPVAAEEIPETSFGDAAKVEGQPFHGNKKIGLQVLLQETLGFDMAVNVFTFQPGAALPFVENHIMEHGLLMLAGAGICRLDGDWHPVQEGDAIWMAPHCPQWFAAVGDIPASYIYYKNINRSPL